MKSILIFVIAMSFSTIVTAAERVNGYFRSNGTYVQPYYRSTPDRNPYNNYSTKGNVNPYTGQEGKVDPYRVRSNYNTGYRDSLNTYNSDNDDAGSDDNE